MKEIKLEKSYISVRQPDGTQTYGGNQAWLTTEAERSFGCGLIAAADILRYLGGREEDPGTGSTVEKKDYLEDIRELAKDFRIRGKLGITGFGLARRMNRIFRREALPFRAKWSIGRRRLERRLPEMLESDIPVLLSVGPGFFHKHQHLPMYRRTVTGEYEQANTMRDHYVTVTGIFVGEPGADHATERTMLRLSSWGSRYYIDLEEYIQYVKQYDNFLFSSILYIRRA